MIADFTTVHLEEIKKDHIKVLGGTGRQRPDLLKVSVGYKAFWQGTAEISYAGPSCFERAQWAAEIIYERLKHQYKDILIEYIGANSVLQNNITQLVNPSYPEIRLRITAKANDPVHANIIGEEVEALYTNGPAGGGGVRKYVDEIIGIVSVLIDRKKITSKINQF